MWAQDLDTRQWGIGFFLYFKALSSSVGNSRHEIYEQVFARMQTQILTSDHLIATGVC